MLWQINAQWKPDAAMRSEVDIRFTADGPDATRVELVHHRFETMGAEAGASMRKDVDGGWPGLIAALCREKLNAAAEKFNRSEEDRHVGIHRSLHSRQPVRARRAGHAGREGRLAIGWSPVAPGAAKSPEHLARHPFGRVPVLEHDGFMLYETQAILRYLDRVLPQPALTPADPRRAARMDQVMNINDWYLFQGVGNVIAFSASSPRG